MSHRIFLKNTLGGNHWVGISICGMSTLCKINNAMLVEKTFFEKMFVFVSPNIIHVHKLYF